MPRQARLRRRHASLLLLRTPAATPSNGVVVRIEVSPNRGRARRVCAWPDQLQECDRREQAHPRSGHAGCGARRWRADRRPGGAAGRPSRHMVRAFRLALERSRPRLASLPASASTCCHSSRRLGVPTLTFAADVIGESVPRGVEPCRFANRSPVATKQCVGVRFSSANGPSGSGRTLATAAKFPRCMKFPRQVQTPVAVDDRGTNSADLFGAGLDHAAPITAGL